MVANPSRRFKVTPVYKENWEALLICGKRYIVNEGGTRSGKTYSIVQVLITYAKHHPNTSITIVSRSLPHLKMGAMRDFMQIMQNWGIYREDDHNRTDHVYYFPNGSYIEFVGLEDPDKARGPGRDILYVNEANMISKPLFDQLDMRTRKTCVLDLNPSDFDVYCYQLADGADGYKIHSTYLNNLSNLPEPQVRAIEAFKEADPVMWQVFGLGLRGASAEQIYTHWKLCDELPGKGDTYYGLDFGYNVPTALVKIETYEGSNYAHEVIYTTKLTTNDLIEKLKRLGIKRSDFLYCDNAEPKTIEELTRAGFNAKPADKDVYAGIQKVKSMPLLITRTSTNIISEIKTYKWKLDKDGKVHPDEVPVKEKDHSMDALRYGIFTHQGAFKFKVVAE